MTTTTPESTDLTARRGDTHVHVNHQHVVLHGHHLTAAQIKQAAIEQGVRIEPDFQLSVLHGKRYEVLADTDVVAVHEGQEFRAVAPDDNS